MIAIRFINLDRADERRRFMERQAQTLGLPLERVRAVEAQDVPDEEMRRLSRSWQRPMTDGEVACFLSHRREWARIAGEGRPALVLEDDALFSRHLPEALAAIGNLSGIELLNIEDVGRKRFLAAGGRLPLAGGVEAVRCLRDKAGAGAYVLWPEGARRLLAATEGRAGLADAVLHGAGLRAFVAEPPLSIQLSVLEEQGGHGPIRGTSLLQAAPKPRGRGPAFVARRIRAQLSLVPLQLGRLAGRVRYERVRVRYEDFGEGVAVAGPGS